jgi:hypothetical protein
MFSDGDDRRDDAPQQLECEVALDALAHLAGFLLLEDDPERDHRNDDGHAEEDADRDDEQIEAVNVRCER